MAGFNVLYEIVTCNGHRTKRFFRTEAEAAPTIAENEKRPDRITLHCEPVLAYSIEGNTFVMSREVIR